MKEEIKVTQEILGNAEISAAKNEVVAYYLSSPTGPNKLLIGNFVSKKECNRTVSKFSPFCTIEVEDKEKALSIWLGKSYKKRS